MLKKCLQFLLHTYQIFLSPQIGPVCRFEPSCSAYAQEAFARYQPMYAFWLTLKRILKCRPGGGHGWDPLPIYTQHEGAAHE